MSDAVDHPSEAGRSEQEIARELRLRPERPRVTRISRKVLLVAGTTVSVAIAGAAVWALQANRKPPATSELYATDHKATADGLAALPHDYAGVSQPSTAIPGSTPVQPGVPVLGPPLPGDLGRPIVAAQAGGQAVPAPAMAGTAAAQPISPEAQRRLEMAQLRQQERETARLSKLFAAAATPEAPPASAAPSSPSAQENGSGGGRVGAGARTASTESSGLQTGQEHKLAFVHGGPEESAVSAGRLTDAASPYVVQAGAVIAGALVTGIRSDLPGPITAQVTQDVFDTPTGRYLLIPQGSRLIGVYDSQVAAGQSRVLLVWTRLLLPNGRSLDLERQLGGDAQGYSGLQDRVDDHWGSLIRAAALSTLLSVGSEAGTSSSENNLAQAIRSGASQSFSQAGSQVVSRQLGVQPTLTIRPGFPVRVIVSRDLLLSPYGGWGVAGG